MSRDIRRRLRALEQLASREPEPEFDCSTIDYSDLDDAELGEFEDLLRSLGKLGQLPDLHQARLDYLFSKLIIKPAAVVEQEGITS